MKQARRTGDGRLHLVIPHAKERGADGWLEPTFELLVIGDFTGRADPRPVEERREIAVRPDTLEKGAQALRADVETPAFRGLRDLLARGPAAHAQSRFDADGIHVQALNASAEDLVLDFEDSPSNEKSGLYKTMHVGNYGGWIGTPFAAVVLGFPLRPTAADADLLRNITQVCQKVAAVVIVEAHPEFWGVESFGELDVERARRGLADLSAAWSALLRSPLAALIALTVPCAAPGSRWEPPGFSISAAALAARVGARWDEHGYPRDLVGSEAPSEVAAALADQGLSAVEIGDGGAARIAGARVCPWLPGAGAGHALGLKMAAQQVCRAALLMLRAWGPVTSMEQRKEQLRTWLAARVADGSLRRAEARVTARDGWLHQIDLEIEIAGFPGAGRASGVVGF